MANTQQKQYREYKKPSWAPPSWVFGPVWTFLYTLIAISFGFVAYSFAKGEIGWSVLLPFVLNLIFNAAYTPLQFRYNAYTLAALDTILLWLTLLWALAVVFPFAAWVSYVNIPYFLWVSFAMVLQITVARYNRN